MTQHHSEAGGTRCTYTPAVIAVGTGIALYLLSKIGELVVVLLLWGAYAALIYAVLHVIAAWAGVSLVTVLRSAACSIRAWAEGHDMQKRAGNVLTVIRNSKQ